MNHLTKHIEQGKVYRRSDLEYFSTSIDRELADLTAKAYLIKVSQGLYYAPLKSKFGIVPPDEHLLIERFLKGDDFLIISPNAYNGLGLGLTQLYNNTWVYNHKRNRNINLNGQKFEFKIKTSFPKELSKEFLLIDFLNNLHSIAESKDDIIHKLYEKIGEFNQEKLRDIALRYGSGASKSFIKALLRTKYKLLWAT
jgi:hypothetical protein